MEAEEAVAAAVTALTQHKIDGRSGSQVAKVWNLLRMTLSGTPVANAIIRAQGRPDDPEKVAALAELILQVYNKNSQFRADLDRLVTAHRAESCCPARAQPA